MSFDWTDAVGGAVVAALAAAVMYEIARRWHYGPPGDDQDEED